MAFLMILSWQHCSDRTESGSDTVELVVLEDKLAPEEYGIA